MTERVRLRDAVWRVEGRAEAGDQVLYQLRSEESGERLTALCPPDTIEWIVASPPALDRRALSPFGLWQLRHELIALTTSWGNLAAMHAGRVQLEPYQLVPVSRLLTGSHRNLLIADDVGLGKTIEAGLCILELAARGVGQRVLLVVPPGLIDQWIEEMSRRFGLVFKGIADSASLDQAQTDLAEGLSPWSFHDRIITSTEYLKRPGVFSAALRRPWDIIVVDEAHYLAESGSPANPYSTRRTRLGSELRKATRSLLLLTATPHNGYRHSFRSLLELVEPTDAALEGDATSVRGRVGRSMVRRLKRQITRAGPDGSRTPAFVRRAPVERLDVHCDSEDERAVFRLVAEYCGRTAQAAADSDQRDLVSFAMQIVKKRMLSSRLALRRTIENRLDALRSVSDEPEPTRAEIRELEADLPLPEEQAERLSSRVIRTSVSRDARRRNAEKRQLREIQHLLDRMADRPDPKITRLVAHLQTQVLEIPDEKAIVFTEYRDTLDALREALAQDLTFQARVAELPGGLTARQRRDRIAAFAAPGCRVLLATDAASEGLNLQHHCRRLYHVELPWNPNRLEQRNGRIDRYGQTRTPHIGYLFYADSPEDRVLDRLVARISQMQDDRVSTPDIIGIVEATRLPERLLAIGPDADVNEASASLERVFDDERQNFVSELSQLLTADEGSTETTDATAADPLIQDDVALEHAMLRVLGTGARRTNRAGEYWLVVPPRLQGPGVPDHYPAATFCRSIALADGMDSSEFVHRLHPLVRACAARAREELRAAVPGVMVAPYLAVRRLAGVTAPGAIFTFLDHSAHRDGALVAAGVFVDGSSIPEALVSLGLTAEDQPGDVPWSQGEATFSRDFETLRDRAAALALDQLSRRAASERGRRSAVAAQLRTEVDAFRIDRMRELEREEAAERAGARMQTELFRETRTDWAARRAAVATQAEARLAHVLEWERVSDPEPPDPLGVLLVFPMDES